MFQEIEIMGLQVHLSEDGYLQINDTAFRNMVKNLKNQNIVES